MIKNIILSVIIFFCSLSLSAQNVSSKIHNSIGDTIDPIARNTLYYFYEPYPLKPGTRIFQIGGSFTLLPITVVENEYPIPALDLQYKYGLLKNLSLTGCFSTNYFSNLLHGGLQWNINTSKLSVGLAGHVGGFAGFITAEGQFENNSAYAIFLMPILRIGLRTQEFSVSMSFVAAYILRSVNKVSDLKAPGPTSTWNDFYCTIAIEQPMFKKTHISLGLSLAFARTPYQSWLLYNTIDQYQFVPEFFFAIQL
jgi:hypothetical protein